MKTKLILILFFTVYFSPCFTQNKGIAINSTGADPVADAILDIDASPNNNKGLLLPRLTTAQRDAILNPERSLMIFNTTTGRLNQTDGGTWYNMLSNPIAAVNTAGTNAGAGVAIATVNIAPHHSAILEVNSNRGGLLIPRLDQFQITAIANPLAGFIVYDVSNNLLKYYNGTSWEWLCGVPDGNPSGSVVNNTNVGINDNNLAPDPSAILDVASTSKALLLPRLTNAERDAIKSPAAGLVIYNKTTNYINYYDGLGMWQELTSTAGATATALPATAVTGSSFTGNWTWSAGSSGVYVEVSSDPNFLTLLNNSPSVFSFGLFSTSNILPTACATYYYRVKAFNTCSGTSAPYSNTITVNLSTGTVSPTPGVWGDTPLTNSSQIYWNNTFDPSVVGYAINTSPNYSTAINTGTNTSYNLTGLACNTTYTAYVWTYNSCGTISTPNTYTFTTACCTPPPVQSPIPLASVQGTTQIIYNWGAAMGATSYAVSTSSVYSTSTNIGNTLSYTLTGLACNTFNPIYVWAVNGCAFNPTPTLLQQNTCCFPSAPSLPSALAPVVSQYQIVFNWTASANTMGYYVSTTNSLASATYIGNVNTYTLSSLNCNTTYNLYVWSVGCGNTGPLVLSATTLACPLPPGQCGSQTFLTYNLDIGTQLAANVNPYSVPVANQTNNGIIEKYCFNDVPANCGIYGAQYSWEEATMYTATDASCDPCGTGGIQGICPTGYHIPSDLEFSRYEHCVETTIAPFGSTSLYNFQTNFSGFGANETGGPPRGSSNQTENAGYKMSSTSWFGSNSSGFNAIAGMSFSSGASAPDEATFLTSTRYNPGTWTVNGGTTNIPGPSDYNQSWVRKIRQSGYPAGSLTIYTYRETISNNIQLGQIRCLQD